MNYYQDFISHDLDGFHNFYTGLLPAHLCLDSQQFEELWQLHPEEFHEIPMHGRLVKTPRWQQAYGVSYDYCGHVNEALPTPTFLQPFIDWACGSIDPFLNALLINWYHADQRHYIGPHHDSIKNMIDGAPIVTVSFGDQRVFKLLQPETKEVREFLAEDGSVFVMPYETNMVWKHAVPHRAKWRGRRVSVTVRALLDLD